MGKGNWFSIFSCENHVILSVNYFLSLSLSLSLSYNKLFAKSDHSCVYVWVIKKPIILTLPISHTHNCAQCFGLLKKFGASQWCVIFLTNTYYSKKKLFRWWYMTNFVCVYIMMIEYGGKATSRMPTHKQGFRRKKEESCWSANQS